MRISLTKVFADVKTQSNNTQIASSRFFRKVVIFMFGPMSVRGSVRRLLQRLHFWGAFWRPCDEGCRPPTHQGRRCVLAIRAFPSQCQMTHSTAHISLDEPDGAVLCVTRPVRTCSSSRPAHVSARSQLFMRDAVTHTATLAVGEPLAVSDCETSHRCRGAFSTAWWQGLAAQKSETEETM